MKPLLCIVIPLYNVREKVTLCLESILRSASNSIQNIEVVLVDDGSPDDSADVAEKWLIANAPVANWRIIHQQNLGLGGARNTGIRNARAQWLWFIDSDDMIPDGALLRVLSAIAEATDEDFVSFNAMFLPEGRQVYGRAMSLIKVAIPQLLENLMPNSPCFNIYRRDFLVDNELYFKEHFLHEDNEFSLRVVAAAKCATYHPEVIYNYYVDNCESITNRFSQKRIDDLIRHFDTYETVAKNTSDRVKLQAIQKANVTPLYWLIISSINDDKAIRRYSAGVLRNNRRRLLQSVSRFPLVERFKYGFRLSPAYRQLKNLQKRMRR